MRVAGRCGDLRRRFAARAVTAGGHDDFRARVRERPGCLVADPGVGARHQRGPARQVDPLEDVAGGALEPEGRDELAHRCVSLS